MELFERHHCEAEVVGTFKDIPAREACHRILIKGKTAAFPLLSSSWEDDKTVPLFRLCPG